MNAHYLRVLYITSLFCVGGCATPQIDDYKWRAPAAKSVMESPYFWSEIANDNTRPVEERRVCIFELWERHVRVGMSLKEIATLLNRPAWISATNVIPVAWISGHIPVDAPTPDSPVFEVNILPGFPNVGFCSVYLKLSGHVSADELGNALRGENVSARIGGITLKQIGYVENGFPMTMAKE